MFIHGVNMRFSSPVARGRTVLGASVVLPVKRYVVRIAFGMGSDRVLLREVGVMINRQYSGTSDVCKSRFFCEVP